MLEKMEIQFLLLPDMIEATINPMIEDKEISGTVLAMHIIHEDQYRDPNALKIIHDIKGNIIYTSRSPVPHCKKFTPELGARRIYGIFGFRWHFLKMFNELPESPLELSEECDSNRFYDHGYTQRIAPYDFVESFSVDVPDDIKKVEKFLSKDEIFKKYK